MKKTVLSKLLLFLSLVVLLASCSKKPDYSRFIPSDAVMVYDFNLDQIYKNGDLKHADDLSFVKMIRKELSNEDDDLPRLINGLFDDPASLGIDLRGDVAFYVDQYSGVGIIATMKSKSKFEKFLTKLTEKNDIDIVSTNGVSCIDAPGGKLAWDKKILYFYVNGEPDMVKKMNLSKEESLAENKGFATYWKKRGDISIWYSMEGLFKMIVEYGGKDVLDEVSPYFDQIKSASFYANILFEKGAIRTTYETLGVDPDSELFKLYGKKFNEKLISFMPENTFLAFAIALDAKTVVSFYEKMNSTKEIMETELAEGVTVADLLSSVNGSIVANLYGFGQSPNGGLLPLFSAAADLNDVTSITDLLAKLQLEKENGCWVYPSIPLYIGIKDDILFVTDDNTVAQTVQGNGYSNGIKDHANSIKNGTYLFADLDLDHYPTSVTSLLPNDAVKLLRQLFERTEFYNTGKTTGEAVTYLKDKKQNSLAALLHFVDDNLLTLGNLASTLASTFSGLGNEDGWDDEEYYDLTDLDNIPELDE